MHLAHVTPLAAMLCIVDAIKKFLKSMSDAWCLFPPAAVIKEKVIPLSEVTVVEGVESMETDS